MDPKLEKYRDSFIKEMNSKLEVLKELAPKLKDNPVDVRSAVEEIYRAYHSVKGTAAFMGSANISDLIRPLEKYLYQIRASVMEGKDILEALSRVEFLPDPGGRGRIVGNIRELKKLLSQSISDLEEQIKKI